MGRRRKNRFRGEFDQRPENIETTPEFFLCSAGAFPRRRNVMSDLLSVNISKQVAAYVLPFTIPIRIFVTKLLIVSTIEHFGYFLSI
jgi:hypothetical protein